MVSHPQYIFEMMIFATLAMLVLFQLKHLAVDFLIQDRFPYMWMNKHKVLHPGGWLHAGGHGIASFLILALFCVPSTLMPWIGSAIALCVGETLIHFAIDYVKMNINIDSGWKCNTSPYFWDLLGIDQLLHQLTYLWMIYMWSDKLYFVI